MTRWSFSLLLLATYLAVFHLWMTLPRLGIVFSAVVTATLLSALFVRSIRRGYFLNAWDALWHGTVIADIAVEGLLVPYHTDRSFYWCALAFVVVVGGYRAMLFRRARFRAEIVLRGNGAKAEPSVGVNAKSTLSSARMNAESWEKQFRETYERGVAAWKTGRRSPKAMFTSEEAAFLAGIGCTRQELFDFVDDFLGYGEPDFDTSLAVQSIRRDYFLTALGAKSTGRTVSMDDLPAKAAAVDGIAWLPRIIVKARLKLRGEMPSDLMYGCGGDRNFLREMNMTVPGFLTLVRDSGNNDRRIIDAVKKSAAMG